MEEVDREKVYQSHIEYWNMLRKTSVTMVGEVPPALVEAYQQAYITVRRKPSIEKLRVEYSFWRKVSKKGTDAEKYVALVLMEACEKLANNLKNGMNEDRNEKEWSKKKEEQSELF